MSQTKKYIDKIVSLEQSLKKKKALSSGELEAMEDKSRKKIDEIRADVDSFKKQMTMQSENALKEAKAYLLERKQKEEEQIKEMNDLFEKKAPLLVDKMYKVLLEDERKNE